MTVLVGVRCRDGIVVGSDSAATFAAGQLKTIEQPIKKVEVIGDNIIVAGTGQGGLGQRFCATVKAAWDAKVFQKSPVDVGRHLCADQIRDFQATAVTQGQYGALVAFPVRNELHLCEFATTDFQPELKTEHMWYVSMGSGQPIADPFLGFIRQTFWRDGMPSCQDALFAVVWTLQHAIKLNPGGINGPMQIAMLSLVSAKPSARMLSDDEISEHLDNVEGAIEHLRSYKAAAAGGAAAPLPDVPK